MEVRKSEGNTVFRPPPYNIAELSILWCVLLSFRLANFDCVHGREAKFWNFFTKGSSWPIFFDKSERVLLDCDFFLRRYHSVLITFYLECLWTLYEQRIFALWPKFQLRRVHSKHRKPFFVYSLFISLSHYYRTKSTSVRRVDLPRIPSELHRKLLWKSSSPNERQCSWLWGWYLRDPFAASSNLSCCWLSSLQTYSVRGGLRFSFHENFSCHLSRSRFRSWWRRLCRGSPILSAFPFCLWA